MYTGPHLIKDNLVFGYDTGYGIANNNTGTRFYPGKPTENLLSLAGSDPTIERSNTHPQYSYYGVNITSYVQSRWSSGNNTLVQSFEGKRDYVVGGTGGGNDGYPRMYVYFSDWSWSSSFGISTYDWSHGKQVFTMPNPNGKAIYMNIYHMNSGNPGKSYSRNHQVEFNNISTPFVNGTRSSTQSLIDLKRTTDIDVSNVSFDSTGQPSFDETNDHITGTLPMNGLGAPHTIEMVFSSNVNQGSIGSRKDPFSIGNSSNGQYSALDVNTTYMNWYFYNQDVTFTNNPTMVANKFYHIVLSYAGGASNNTTKKVWINGIQQSLSTGSSLVSALPNNPSFSVGRDRGRNTAYWPGEIPVWKVYQKSFTQEEVKQNFRAYKNRFNL